MVKGADHDYCCQRQVPACNNGLLHHSGLCYRPRTPPSLKRNGIRAQQVDAGDPPRKGNHQQENPCLRVIERACWQEQQQAGHGKPNKIEYQRSRNGFHGSSLPVRPVPHGNSAHRSAKSRYSQRSIDCQQPQQRRRTETTATGLSALNSTFDRLMGGAAQLRGSSIGTDFPIGRDDVHTLPCRLQWNSLGGAGDCWSNHRHRPGHELPGPTRHARGLRTSTWPQRGDIQLAISGDVQLAINGEFHMATDIRPRLRARAFRAAGPPNHGSCRCWSGRRG